jgi:hypothetical protein
MKSYKPSSSDIQKLYMIQDYEKQINERIKNFRFTKIGLLKETEIRASSNSDGVKRDLIFQRYSGDLIWLLSRTDDTVINLIEYKCSITKKIL